MEKRLILAIALSFLILLTWSTFASKAYHLENKGVASKPITLPITQKEDGAAPPPHAFSKFQNQKYAITFIEPWAAIQEVAFLKYQNAVYSLKSGFLLADKNLTFKKTGSTENSITFEARDATKKIKKHFTFHNDKYIIELEVNVQSENVQSEILNMPVILAALTSDAKNADARYQDVAVGKQDQTVHLNPLKDASFSDAKFLAVRDKYFCAILESAAGPRDVFVKKINNYTSEAGFARKAIILPAGASISEKFYIYLGPQELQPIEAVKKQWASVIHYGTFDFIAQLLLQLLRFFYALVHNWGWSIVLLSFAVYLILYPLTLKQMRSMKEMQILQPKVEALRNAYKDNPQKLNREIMDLYREHKVNPLGGCLPLILQMPIFFALYQALMRSVALKGAHFLWIKDLSAPDRLFTMPFSLPVLNNEVNILPILMAIGMFIQQKISLTKNNVGAAAEQQKMMLILMPLLFGFIFYRMPSGLVLYWFINSALTLVYQLRVNRGI